MHGYQRPINCARARVGNLAALRVTAYSLLGGPSSAAGESGSELLAAAFEQKAFAHVTLWVGGGAAAR